MFFFKYSHILFSLSVSFGIEIFACRAIACLATAVLVNAGKPELSKFLGKFKQRKLSKECFTGCVDKQNSKEACVETSCVEITFFQEGKSRKILCLVFASCNAVGKWLRNVFPYISLKSLVCISHCFHPISLNFPRPDRKQ